MREKKSSATESVTRLLLSLGLNTHLTVNCSDCSLPGCCSNLKPVFETKKKKRKKKRGGGVNCVVKKMKMGSFIFLQVLITLCIAANVNITHMMVYIWCFGIYSEGM